MGYRFISMRNEDTVNMLKKAKELIESACEMLEQNEMDERNGMGYRGQGGMSYRNQSRDSRGRYMRNRYPEEERMMRSRDQWDEEDMPRGRYGY